MLFLHVFLAFPSGRLHGQGRAPAHRRRLRHGVRAAARRDGARRLRTRQPARAHERARRRVLVAAGAARRAERDLSRRRRDPRRFAGAGTPRPPRRWPALLVDSFALALVMLAFLFLSAAFGLVSGQLAFETLRRVTLFVIGLAPLAFLVGLLHARLARAAVGDLLIGLQARPAPADLRRRARPRTPRSLADARVLAAGVRELGRRRRQRCHARRRRRRSGDDADRPRADEHMAALTHDASLNDEPELLESVAAAAGMALENARLHAESRARARRAARLARADRRGRRRRASTARAQPARRRPAAAGRGRAAAAAAAEPDTRRSCARRGARDGRQRRAGGIARRAAPARSRPAPGRPRARPARGAWTRSRPARPSRRRSRTRSPARCRSPCSSPPTSWPARR